MSRSVNKVILIGRVGTDPEIRTTGSGTKVAKLSLATSRRYTSNGQTCEDTQWHRLTVWGRLADVVEQYVHKGDRLYVEGRIEYSTTEDNQGVTRYWTDIVVHELVILGGERQGAPAKAPSSPFEDDSDDLPF